MNSSSNNIEYRVCRLNLIYSKKTSIHIRHKRKKNISTKHSVYCVVGWFYMLLSLFAFHQFFFRRFRRVFHVAACLIFSRYLNRCTLRKLQYVCPPCALLQTENRWKYTQSKKKQHHRLSCLNVMTIFNGLNLCINCYICIHS